MYLAAPRVLAALEALYDACPTGFGNDRALDEALKQAEAVLGCAVQPKPTYAECMARIGESQCTLPKGHVGLHLDGSDGFTWAGTYAESLRRAAAALERLNEATTEHLDYEREVAEQDELLDEPGPQIEEVWGSQRYV